MYANPSSLIESMISDYLKYRQNVLTYSKQRNDAEKEYNKLIGSSYGEEKVYSMSLADKIYKTYLEMISFQELLRESEKKFSEAEEKLREVGRILFEARIDTEVAVPLAGGAYDLQKITVRFFDGQVRID